MIVFVGKTTSKSNVKYYKPVGSWVLSFPSFFFFFSVIKEFLAHFLHAPLICLFVCLFVYSLFFQNREQKRGKFEKNCADWARWQETSLP